MNWCKAEISPDRAGCEGCAIIYCTANNKLGTFKEGKVKDRRDWEWLVDKYSIKYWTTQEEIIRQINDNDNNERD